MYINIYNTQYHPGYSHKTNGANDKFYKSFLINNPHDSYTSFVPFTRVLYAYLKNLSTMIVRQIDLRCLTISS